MQRQKNSEIVISCDFCGTDWDQVQPMVEGHRGSVICLTCLKQALEAMAASTADFTCTLCLRDLPATKPSWRYPHRPQAANPAAVVCVDCVKQASGAFSKDGDVDFT